MKDVLVLSKADRTFLAAVGIEIPTDADFPTSKKTDLVTLYRLREDLIPGGGSMADTDAAI